MLHAYLEDYIFSRKEQRFSYDIWMKEYLHFYQKDRIMIILFEDIIKEPEKILTEVQEFIGVKPKKIPNLPHSNSGKRVSRNYLAARINGMLHRVKLKQKENASDAQRKRLKELQNFVWKFTLVDNEEKLSAADREILCSFYMDSIHEVENILGRSLKGVWYE